jgi:hypothetical protein
MIPSCVFSNHFSRFEVSKHTRLFLANFLCLCKVLFLHLIGVWFFFHVLSLESCLLVNNHILNHQKSKLVFVTPRLIFVKHYFCVMFAQDSMHQVSWICCLSFMFSYVFFIVWLQHSMGCWTPIRPRYLECEWDVNNRKKKPREKVCHMGHISLVFCLSMFSLFFSSSRVLFTWNGNISINISW